MQLLYYIYAPIFTLIKGLNSLRRLKRIIYFKLLYEESYSQPAIRVNLFRNYCTKKQTK